MGTVHVECHRDLRAKLRTEPYASIVKIERESILSTECYLLLIRVRCCRQVIMDAKS